MQRSRGFTLIEVTITCAIAALILAVLIPLSLGSRPLGAAAAVQQFDASVALAKSVAAVSGNGSTLLVGAATMRVFAGRPNALATLAPASAPVAYTAAIAESTLGGAPLTIFFDTAGHASAMAGDETEGGFLARDPGCPSPQAQLVLTIRDARSAFTRSLACTQTVSSGP